MCINPRAFPLIKLFINSGSLEEVPSKNFLTKQELECEAHFVETHKRDSNGRYVVRLPFIEPPSHLGNSLNIALSSLSRLENKFMQDDVLAVKYRDFLREYESLNHMSCLGPVKHDDSFRVFIPHHPIIRDYSQTMKLRVVFNASRPTSTNLSINDCLHVGQKLQNEICSILLRWRQHPYVLCADIAHMFRQILIHPDDRKIMGDLPTPRVTPSRPFTHTGIDYAGPYLVRSSSGRGIKSHKAWISVFICFAVKAIHLELVHDYSTASFLAAFRRFVARRGIPTDVYSDNGPNFRGADRELSQTFRKLQNDPNLISHLASDGTTWHFIPPIAPHFGSLWEAGVKSVKLHLRKLLSNSTPTVE